VRAGTTDSATVGAPRRFSGSLLTGPGRKIKQKLAVQPQELHLAVERGEHAVDRTVNA